MIDFITEFFLNLTCGVAVVASLMLLLGLVGGLLYLLITGVGYAAFMIIMCLILAFCIGSVVRNA